MPTPYRSPWVLRPDQTSTRAADGAFALTYVEIASLHVHGYYAMRWPTPGPPNAMARIAPRATPPLALDAVATLPSVQVQVPPATVQSFGRLGGMEVGVIDVPIHDQPGQALTLSIAPPDAPAPTWHLSFLEQVAPAPHAQGKAGLGGDTGTIPEIRVVAFLGYQGNRHSGWFALARPTTPTSYLPSIFFVSDLDGTVAPLTEAQFVAGTTGGTALVKPYVPPSASQRTSDRSASVPQNPTQAPAPPRSNAPQPESSRMRPSAWPAV